MPFFDRYWWLQFGAALLAAITAVVLPVDYLAEQLPIDERIGFSPLPDILLAGFIALLLLVSAVVVVIRSLRARARMRRRYVAITGDQAAVPYAVDIPYPATPPDVAAEPLSLRWLAYASWRPGRARLELAGGMAVLIVGAVIVIVPFLLSFALAGLVHDDLIPFTLIAFAYFGTAPHMCARALRHAYGSPTHMEADTEGIRWHAVLGAPRMLRWHDIRLVEVAGARQNPEYIVYGERGSIRWPSGYTYGEQPYRTYAILDLIAAKTGLTPRTFARKLAAPTPFPDDGSLTIEAHE